MRLLTNDQRPVGTSPDICGRRCRTCELGEPSVGRPFRIGKRVNSAMTHIEPQLVGSAQLLYFLGHALGGLTVAEACVIVDGRL